MVIRGIKASEDLHGVDYVSLLFGLFAFLLLSALEIEETAL